MTSARDGGSTIVALSSGAPPAAIGVIRVSGPKAKGAARALVGRLLEPRRATLARLRDADGALLDEALVLWFPGPRSATGEDLLELHCHGGRAVVDAVHRALVALPGLRSAEAGEFTRRAFANGRMDLAQAEGLADLLAAETELQRSTALASAQGQLSGQIGEWREAVLKLSAQVEAALDFSDEDDVEELPEGFTKSLEELGRALGNWLSRARAEKLGEGFRVALAGPPNAGKSSLFNALVESEAAITSPIAGTTRDAIERNVSINGIPLSFVDTAGLRSDSEDAIEQVGIDRAKSELDRADRVLWLGPEGEGPRDAWEIASRSDAADFEPKAGARFKVSAKTGEGVSELKVALVKAAGGTLPKPGEAALNARQHHLLSEAHTALCAASDSTDLLIVGEELRTVRLAFDRLVGRTTTEDMLDALFGRFCIGK
ncbi:MAG: tRNA uridine-5-carboxymethylaminomethyl(34) synthesis GTPase MnmE [Erythrobacter sp.]|uniref:tRNA uridine-5-carboxymethylaminomethyl(34) synthesis GTPase MnmE n=1 Tax=Erythrobacter sp. TaxID=1042 RepID=UPI002601F1D0|nr:tRNA uridine-5-carboxymethylaminomethyl(34) synthesis GTPase MnmE [Erythrobacter sp.]MDJ0978472.1 tRNA uridine-5-carboxymethylaminomethyl(34) synthesis GTPase MnmE [Erythrobacter sp.]